MLEPFLDNGTRINISGELLTFKGLCLDLAEADHNNKKRLDQFSSSYNSYEKSFRRGLMQSLFKEHQGK